MGILESIKKIKEKRWREGERYERIYIRVTEEEKEVIQKLANCQALNVSSFVRWVILSKYLNDFIKTE